MAPQAEIRTQGLIPGKHTVIRAREYKGREGMEENLSKLRREGGERDGS